MKLRLACLVTAALLASCASAQNNAAPSAAPAVASASAAKFAGPTDELLKKIDNFFEDKRFANAYWGAVIESLDTGEVWYERNPNKMFMPASNEKILTTAATLMTLGPNWKFTTTLSTNGTIANGTLNGDLIVTADGDPTLYTRFYDDPRTVFYKFVDELKAKGITKISGNVVGNDDLWEDSHFDDDWPLSGMPTWYSAEYGPLALNENYVDINIIPPSDANGQIKIVPNLPSSYYTIENNLQLVTEGSTSISNDRQYGSNTIVLSGRVKVGDRPREISPTITNPTAFYVHVLTEVLEEKGIDVAGKGVDIDDLNPKPKTDGTVLATHHSEPLSKILAGLMKRSQNMYAENMTRVIAQHETGRGTFRGGREVVQKRLQELGVSSDQFVYTDGSGLSRYNFVSPRAITEILKGMHKHEHGKVWHELMPIAGVDGTLASRMKGTPAERNVHAKTGTISNVRALSGYVTTAEGEQIVFSFLVNAHTTSSRATEEVTDGVLALIAGYKGKSVPPTGQ